MQCSLLYGRNFDLQLLIPALQVRDDVAAGTHTGSSSVTKGLLWLKRCAALVTACMLH